jgi:hypothetical protein
VSFYSFLESAVDIDWKELRDYLSTVPGASVADHDDGIGFVGNADTPWHNHEDGPSIIIHLYGPEPESSDDESDEALVSLLGVPEPQSTVAIQHGGRGDTEATMFLAQRIAAAISERWSPCAYHFQQRGDQDHPEYYTGEEIRQATRLGVRIFNLRYEQELLPLRIAQALQPERRVRLTRVPQAPPAWDPNLQPWDDCSEKSGVRSRPNEFHHIFFSERVSSKELRTFLRSFPGMYAPENGIVCRRYSDLHVSSPDTSISTDELKRFDVYDGYITAPALPEYPRGHEYSVYVRLLPLTWGEILNGWFSDEEPVEKHKKLNSTTPEEIVETLGSTPQSILSLVQIGIYDSALAQEVVCALARRWRCVYLLRCKDLYLDEYRWDDTVRSGEDVCKAVRCGVDVTYVSEEFREILPPETYDEPQLTYVPTPQNSAAPQSNNEPATITQRT